MTRKDSQEPQHYLDNVCLINTRTKLHSAIFMNILSTVLKSHVKMFLCRHVLYEMEVI